MVVDDENAGGHILLIGRSPSADKTHMKRRRTELQAWLWGEVVLAGLLGASLALFVAYPALRTQYNRPLLLLVLETTMALAGVLVALLAAARFSVVGLWTDLLLSAGFLIGSLSSVAFAVVPVLNGGSLNPADAWAALLGSITAQGLIAIAPFLGGRVRVRERALRDTVIAAGVVLVFAWLVFRAHGSGLPALTAVPGVRAAPPGLVSALAAQALLALLAVVGWGRRLVRTGDDLCRRGGLPAPDRLRVDAGRRLAGHPLRRGRPCRRRGAGAGRPRDPRRPRAVPVRALDPRPDARGGRPRGRGRAAAQGSRGARAAGGALRHPRAFVRKRNGSIRLRATPLRRVPDGGRGARGGPRDRPSHPPGARRTDRDLPDRAGGTRQRPPARPRLARRGRHRPAALRRAVRRDRGRRRRVPRRRDDRRAGAAKHARPGVLDRGGIQRAQHPRPRHCARGRSADVDAVNGEAPPERGFSVAGL